MNPNGNHPLAEEFFRPLKLKLLSAKDAQPFIQIGTEPQSEESEGVENIHRSLRALLNDRNIRIERKQTRRFSGKSRAAVPSHDAEVCHVLSLGDGGRLLCTQSHISKSPPSVDPECGPQLS
jgi:hypothetical protein